MTSNSQITKRRQLLLSLSVLSVLACAAYFLAIPMYKANAKKKAAPTTMLATSTFATSTALPHPIPDNTAAGTSLSIPVAGLTDEVRGVALNITYDQPVGGGGHTWLGDLHVVLSSPAPANMHTIHSRTGSTTGTGAGDSSDAQGPYTFTDGTVADWWVTAVTLPGGTVPAGMYKTHANGSATPTDMNPVFQGPALADIDFDNDKKSNGGKFEEIPVDNLGNGTWTLAISDNAGGDTGRVAALSLTITTLAPTNAAASIRGAVLTGNGQGVPRATVTITNTDTGETISYRTNQFGYFRFEELPVGHFYTMTVDHRQYTFDPQSFTLEGDIGDAEFRSK